MRYDVELYRVDFMKQYTVIIAANNEEEARNIARRMNDVEIEDAATYISDAEVQSVKVR